LFCGTTIVVIIGLHENRPTRCSEQMIKKKTKNVLINPYSFEHIIDQNLANVDEIKKNY